MKATATAGRKPAHSQSITTEAGHASLKTAALGADWFLPYPRPLADYRTREGFNQETRVWECFLFHVLRHEGDPAATYAQVAGNLRPDGSETGIRNGRRRGQLRPMTQADIGIILRMDKGDVSRAVKKLVKRGLVRQEGRSKLHLVGNPDAKVRSTGGTKVGSTPNFDSPFLPPPSHPREMEWLKRLTQVDQQLKATYNADLRALRGTRNARKITAYAEVAAFFLGVKPADLIHTTEQADLSSPRTETPLCAVASTHNLAPSEVASTHNSEAPSVVCTGDSIREERERESGDLFSEPPPRRLAGHSGVTEQGASQPASRPGSSKKNRGKKVDKRTARKGDAGSARQFQRCSRTDAENLDQFAAELGQRFTRRFAIPPSRKWAADILKRLKGADWQQLFDLITSKPHIMGWAGVALLADDCASSQKTWRASEPTAAQTRKPTPEDKAKAYERKRHEGTATPPKRT